MPGLEKHAPQIALLFDAVDPALLPEAVDRDCVLNGASLVKRQFD
jgi:hypothetical protein